MAAPKKKPHERVMELVESELKKNPKVSNTDLFKKAKRVSRSVSALTIRQFHAKYPLQVKRRLAPKKPRKPRPKGTAASRAAKAPASNRDAIRRVLLSFAKELSAAESQTATIDVLAKLDKYVDRVVKAAG